MDATLRVSAGDIGNEELQSLTRKLIVSINQETDIKASLPESQSAPGARGLEISIGQILVTALTSGAIAELFRLLRAYFERRPALTVEIHLPDGRKFDVSAKKLEKDQLEQTLGAAHEFVSIEK